MVTEIERICALQAAMKGYQVTTMDEVAAQGDVFVTATVRIDVVSGRALRQYRPGRRGKALRKEVEVWRRLLREDRERGLTRPEVPIEALYDEATGLPV